MGFNSVYKGLLEVFPQVDSRILRAVAIENSKDVDVAVGVVLADVIPSLSIQSGIGFCGGSFSDQGPSLLNPYGDVQAFDTADGTHSGGGNDGVYEEVIDKQIPSIKPGEFSRFESGISCLNSNNPGPNTGANEGHDQENVDAFGENVSLPGMHRVGSTEAGPKDISRAILDELSYLLNDTDGSLSSSSLHEEHDKLVRKNHRSVIQVVDVDPSPVQNISQCSPESSQLVTVPVSPLIEVKEPGADVPSLTISGEDVSSSEMVDCKNVEVVDMVSNISMKDLEKEEPNGIKGLLASEVDDFQDEPSMKSVVTSRSGQMCSIELLEDVIEKEKIEKIALRSAKDSLLSLVSEVETKEKYVEKAREEAAQGGLNAFSRVEDLKKMLQRAVEANDMHAGEVYGEKAILATEMRELQSRLNSLSEERVKALAILDEIRQPLEVRLVLAEKKIKEAESEKLKKEESALNYLAHEEINMAKVVQESKILEQQAEENSKLREFLMERGRLVDVLQGEISVICQDVNSMKSKFDQGISLSKSLSFSQTTCMSTFSSSSLISASSDKVPEVVVSPENKKGSLSDLSDDQFLCEDEVPSTSKEFVDVDDWLSFDVFHEVGTSNKRLFK